MIHLGRNLISHLSLNALSILLPVVSIANSNAQNPVFWEA